MTNTISHETSGLLKPVIAWDLLLIILLAVIVRLVLFNGAFGSDDLTYYQRAVELARGEWTTSDYNGALRYGFNLPAAGLISLFGESLFVANLWPLACSLIEIGALYFFASAAMCRRAGVFAALLLATAPLHIAVATRIHADPVVSMFVTLAFVLIYFGAMGKRPVLLFVAGLAIGGIYWAKELAGVTWFAFLPILWFFRHQWRNCFYVLGGAVLMLLLHGLLMLFIAGDPLHLVRVVLGAVKRNFIDGVQGEDSAGYYLRYLFIDLRHTGALGIIALASFLFFPRLAARGNGWLSGYSYTLIWWISLLLVLSVFPVSISPLRFTMKQSNYITLFLGPTALLAGMTIATLPKNYGRIALIVCLAIGVLLGMLQQADYRVFTANSKALAAFAVQHPRAVIVGSANNSGMGNLWSHLAYPNSSLPVIFSFRDFNEHRDLAKQRLQAADAVFAVLDQETMYWAAGKNPVTSPLPCWRHELTLEPNGLGLGNDFAKLASESVSAIQQLRTLLDHLAYPLPADVYRVDGGSVFCDGD